MVRAVAEGSLQKIANGHSRKPVLLAAGFKRFSWATCWRVIGVSKTNQDVSGRPRKIT